MASGNTSVPIVSAAGGTGKEFFSGSEEKTQNQKREEAGQGSTEDRAGSQSTAVRWASGGEVTQ